MKLHLIAGGIYLPPMTLADPIKRDQGISPFEMFLVVAFLAILGSIGFVTVSDVVGGTKQTKLLSDVKALNSAVLGYIASNGNLSSAKTPEEVIAKLKSVSLSSHCNGIRQSFIDARIDIDLQSEKESSKSSLRA
ncbi:MAG: hypothetical protein P1U81_18885 [Verrucomicrobiales bacterium]|nr:hypothetical protein [bacterium]MDF2378311.1 hypothetical protein [Verrucomicrobiales bacterium]